jgi:hypothetical protein
MQRSHRRVPCRAQEEETGAGKATHEELKMSALHTTSSRHPRGKSALPPVASPAASATPGIIAEMASLVATELPIDPAAKWLMIAEAAYYCAEKRGFEPGHELEDWLEAEARIEGSTSR